MLFASYSRLGAIFLFCLCIHAALASSEPLGAHRRRQDEVSSASKAVESSTTNTAQTALQTDQDGDSAKVSSSVASQSPSSTESSSSSSESSTSGTPSDSTVAIAAATSDIVGSRPTSIESDRSNFSTDLTPNALPLPPDLTPAWGVAGALLILTGLVYGSIGIKQKRYQVCMSAAYLASLATAVLIVYVTSLPVSDAKQGGYLVAILVPGLVLGAASSFFQELFEGLGCLFGGFSLSMWLLILRRGGLVQSTGGKAIFISAISLAVFATSFSHVTRPYGLIFSTSFGGATAVVLGIDCYSRAGLKEFWAWIWDVNNDLFPLKATTYPLTKGIKVETAAIILLLVPGILSQIKLWAIIKERRAKRAKQRTEEQRIQREEDEKIGRRLERFAAVERVRWERTYADKDGPFRGEESLRDSGFGDGDSQKHDLHSAPGSIAQRADTGIEMLHIVPPTPPETVVAQEETPQQQSALENGTTIEELPEPGETDQSHALVDESSASPQALKRASQRSLPDRPLSYNSVRSISGQGRHVQKRLTSEDGEVRSEKRSSQMSARPSLRQSLHSNHRLSKASLRGRAKSPISGIEVGDDSDGRSSRTGNNEQNNTKHESKRLSANSAHLLRALSERSRRSSHNFVRLDDEGDDSNDKASSVAATLDEHEEGARQSRRSSWMSHFTNEDQPMAVEHRNEQIKRESTATVETAVLDIGSDPNRQQRLSTQSGNGLATSEEASDLPPRAASRLTMDALPSRLPKVALNFRTNEWAKQISNDVEPAEPSPLFPTTSDHDSENVAPVNVDALQQTSSGTIPRAPAVSRRSRTMSPTTMDPRKRALTPSIHPVEAPLRAASPRISQIQAESDKQPSPEPMMNRPVSTSQETLQQVPPYARGSTPTASVSPMPGSTPEPVFPGAGPFAGSTINLARNSPSPVPYAGQGAANTLLSQRDLLLRGKMVSPSAMPSSTPPPAPRRSASAQSLHALGPGQAMMYGPGVPMVAEDPEEDDLTLSARREMLRLSQWGSHVGDERTRASSALSGPIAAAVGAGGTGVMTGGRRVSGLGAAAQAEGKQTKDQMDRRLANLRASVQEDLRREGERRDFGRLGEPLLNNGSSGGGSGSSSSTWVPVWTPPDGRAADRSVMGMGMGIPMGPTTLAEVQNGMRNGGVGAGLPGVDRHREAMRRLQSRAG